MQDDRLCDLLRVVNNDRGVYTWWPYQRDAFERDEGLRFDLALGDKAVTKMVTKVWVDKEERRIENKLAKPSDHAPLVIDLLNPKTETITITRWCYK